MPSILFKPQSPAGGSLSEEDGFYFADPTRKWRLPGKALLIFIWMADTTAMGTDVELGQQPWCEFLFYELNWHHIDGLVQERRNSVGNALGLRLSCTKPWTLASWRVRSLSIQPFWRGHQQGKHQSSALLVLCKWNSLVSGGFHSQTAINVECVSMPYCPHIYLFQKSISKCPSAEIYKKKKCFSFLCITDEYYVGSLIANLNTSKGFCKNYHISNASALDIWSFCTKHFMYKFCSH